LEPVIGQILRPQFGVKGVSGVKELERCASARSRL